MSAAIIKQYTRLSTWGKVLLFTLIWVVIICMFRPKNGRQRDGFTQDDAFQFITGPDVYDHMYATIYDQLLFSNIKNDYEIGEIINRTKPTLKSRILDVGCGTGHHVAQWADKQIPARGIDISSDMIQQAKENYPKYEFDVGDGRKGSTFSSGEFTHITCLYFTIYYMTYSEKQAFFQNCMKWLAPGGYLVLHLVDRTQFDPILPPGNPLLLVSPQKYADDRITHTTVQFNDFTYTADFKLDEPHNKAVLVERFKDKASPKVRKQEHELFMEPTNQIVRAVQQAGFIHTSKVDLVHCQYEYQYLYIFTKPN